MSAVVEAQVRNTTLIDCENVESKYRQRRQKMVADTVLEQGWNYNMFLGSHTAGSEESNTDAQASEELESASMV